MPITKEEKRTATSIKIKPTVWKEAKKTAIDVGKTVSELMEEAIVAYIKEHKKDDTALF